MEIGGAYLDEEWDSLTKMFFFGENHDSLLHFNGETPFLSNSENAFLPSNLHHTFSTNLYSISQESSNNGETESALLPNEDHQPFLHDNVITNTTFDQSMNYYNVITSSTMPVLPGNVMEEILYSNGEDQEMEFKRKYEDQPENLSLESPEKIPRVSRNAEKKLRKKKKIEEENNEEEGNGGGSRQIRSSSCSSEDDSNASQELNGGSGSTSESNRFNGKMKAIRGSATDPQSLYARRRRERINERLRILQNLVPNGTKVDISTMLEEAVQYVKFLQLQIKLLSSDDLWMYAPLAYNGMDIGIYQNISPNLSTQN